MGFIVRSMNMCDHGRYHGGMQLSDYGLWNRTSASRTFGACGQLRLNTGAAIRSTQTMNVPEYGPNTYSMPAYTRSDAVYIPLVYLWRPKKIPISILVAIRCHLQCGSMQVKLVTTRRVLSASSRGARYIQA